MLFSVFFEAMFSIVDWKLVGGTWIRSSIYVAASNTAANPVYLFR